MVILGSFSRGYILAGVIDAVCGAVAVIGFTRAIPALISKITSAMMQNMMAQFPEGGCSLEDFCSQMMMGFGEARAQ